MKIQLVLGGIQTAPQAAHHLDAHAGTMKRQCLAAGGGGRRNQRHHIVEIFHSRWRRLAQTRPRVKLGKPLRRRNLNQGFDVAHRFSKCVRVGRIILFSAKLRIMLLAHVTSLGYRGFQRYSIVRTATPASAAQAVK